MLGQNAEMKTWEPTPTHIFVSEGSHPPLAGGLVVRFGGAKRDTVFVEHHFAISSKRQDGEDCGLAGAAPSRCQSGGTAVVASLIIDARKMPLRHSERTAKNEFGYFRSV